MKLRPFLASLPGAFVMLASSATLSAQNSAITIGQQTNANVFFNNTLSRSYNFGVTSSGGSSALSLNSISVFLQANNRDNHDVNVSVYSGFGGTGTLLSTGVIPAASLTGQFDPYSVTLGTPLSLTSGAYSVVITTDHTTNYGFKQGALLLTNTAGVTLTSGLWVQDNNTTGTATTTIAPAAGYVLADKGVNNSSVNFGNYRVGSTLSQSVTLSNTAFATSNNTTEGLSATSSLSGQANISGLTSSYINQGASSSFNVGLNTASVGAQSGTVALALNSVVGASASARTGGALSVGSQDIAVSGVGYRPAAAGFDTTSASLGKFHVGATNISGNVTVSNTATTSDAYSEGLSVASNSTTGGASVSNLPTGLIAAGGSSTVLAKLASVSSVGNNSGTVTLGLSTSGVGTSGLSAASIGSQVVTVSAQGYSGQSTWNTNASGTWGSFNSWDNDGGTPGIDGALSTTDTATFGGVTTGATTVSLNGASPVLTSLTFNNSGAAYSVAEGTGGIITLGTAQSAATVTNTAGNHTVSTTLMLARNTTVSTAAGSKLTLSGAVTGANGLIKSGSGALTLTANSSLVGDTTVNGGLLTVNGAISSSSVTIASGGTLGGSGTVGSTFVEGGATISPGNSPGLLTIDGDTNWSSDGNYNWQMVSATGTAGTDWDKIDVTGTLDLTSLTSTSKFNLNLWSLSDNTTDGNANNFDNTVNQSWTILTAGTGISGFSSDKFNIYTGANNGTTGFTNTLAGTFSIAQDGNNLNLVYTVVPEPTSALLGALGLFGSVFLRRRKA